MTRPTNLRTLSLVGSLAASVIVLAACEPVKPATSGAPIDEVEGPTVTALPVISASDVAAPEADTTEQTTSAPVSIELNNNTIAETAPTEETHEETQSVDPSVDEAATSQDDGSEALLAETDGDTTSIVSTDTALAAPETDAPVDIIVDVISEGAIAEETAPERSEAEQAEAEQAEAELPTPEPDDDTQQLAMVQPAAPPPPPPPPAELAPATLLGIDQAGLFARLGTADLLRQEGNMEVWQYRLTACVVDFYIYPAATGRQVTHWDWRVPKIGQTLDVTACRQQLAERDSASQG